MSCSLSCRRLPALRLIKWALKRILDHQLGRVDQNSLNKIEFMLCIIGYYNVICYARCYRAVFLYICFLYWFLHGNYVTLLKRGNPSRGGRGPSVHQSRNTTGDAFTIIVVFQKKHLWFGLSSLLCDFCFVETSVERLHSLSCRV